MDDTAYREFFTRPTQTYQRRYEALRAVFVEERSQKEVADEFGFTYGSMRQLVFEFRQTCDAENEPTESPFFETPLPDALLPMPMTPRIRRSLIGESWCYPVANRCVSEPERQAYFCSCRC